MSSSAIPVQQTTSAIESGFIAAGVTISAIAAAQSVVIVLGWIFGA